jgi:hypothetical protein
MSDVAFEGWALVEQMGFRSSVAKVREVEQFGAKMLRLDVPFWDGNARLSERAPDGYTTRFAGGPSLYQVSPLDEDLALNMARKQSDPRPVRPTTFRLEDKSEDYMPETPPNPPDDGPDDGPF